MATNLKRAYLDDVGFIYHTFDSPKDIDADPRYFDGLVNDLTDTHKYFNDDPMVSGVLRDFHVISGDVLEEYYWASFKVLGIKRKFNKGRAPTFFLVCDKVGDWNHVVINPKEKPVAVEVAEPMKRGPGRPPKVAAA